MPTNAPLGGPPPALSEWSADLTTRAGLVFHVRSAAPDDEARLTEFFTHVTQEDLRFRFLSSIRKVGHELASLLVEFDHRRTENFLAFDEEGGTLIATAMLAADEGLDRAEVAIAVRSDFKHKGLGWTLLEYVAEHAAARGIRAIESLECRDNREAIDLQREMGFAATPCPGDPNLLLVRKMLSPTPRDAVPA